MQLLVLSLSLSLSRTPRGVLGESRAFIGHLSGFLGQSRPYFGVTRGYHREAATEHI